MVCQLNIQTIPLTRRSHLIVGFPVAGTAAWVWSVTGAVRRPRIRTVCLSGSIASSLTLTICLGWPRFRTQAPGWKVLCEREGGIVIGTYEHGSVGMCFMPVTGPKTRKNHLHLHLTSSAQDRQQEIERLPALRRAGPASGRLAQSPGRCWPTPRK
jgi:hypothetical protein